MAADALPTHVISFIKSYIHSVEELEILCLFAEEQSRTWSTAQVFQRIQSSEKSVAARLEIFRTSGLLTSEGEGFYKLANTEPTVVETLKAVVGAYRDRRVSIIECIYKQPASPIQNFADAFKFRKEK